MLKKLFGEPELSGLESDAYWLGLFLGIVASFGVTFVLLFFLVPAGLATELSPVLLVVALVLSYPLARGFQRLLKWGLRETREWLYPARYRDEED